MPSSTNGPTPDFSGQNSNILTWGPDGADVSGLKLLGDARLRAQAQQAAQSTHQNPDPTDTLAAWRAYMRNKSPQDSSTQHFGIGSPPRASGAVSTAGSMIPRAQQPPSPLDLSHVSPLSIPFTDPFGIEAERTQRIAQLHAHAKNVENQIHSMGSGVDPQSGLPSAAYRHLRRDLSNTYSELSQIHGAAAGPLSTSTPTVPGPATPPERSNSQVMEDFLRRSQEYLARTGHPMPGSIEEANLVHSGDPNYDPSNDFASAYGAVPMPNTRRTSVMGDATKAYYGAHVLMGALGSSAADLASGGSFSRSIPVGDMRRIDEGVGTVIGNLFPLQMGENPLDTAQNLAFLGGGEAVGPLMQRGLGRLKEILGPAHHEAVDELAEHLATSDEGRPYTHLHAVHDFFKNLRDLTWRPPKDYEEALRRLQGRIKERAWIQKADRTWFHMDASAHDPLNLRPNAEQRAAMYGANVYHSHPNETFFSGHDLRMFVDNQVRSGSVVTPNGRHFLVTFEPGHNITPDEIEQASRRAVSDAHARLQQMGRFADYSDGSIAEQEFLALKRIFADKNSKFAGHVGVEYRRIR